MRALATVAAAAATLAVLGASRPRPAGVERLYVLDCGWAHAPDQSRWSPGVNQGVPIDLSDNCYLVRHRRGGWLLWDTGFPDALADQPAGQLAPTGVTSHRRVTLAAQLARIGVAPEAIRWIGISHTHPDHVGNVDLFPAATVLIHRAEYDWAFSQGKRPFSPEHPVRKLETDLDVFGDGSVVVLSTPGHTPGHQSLLVRLPQTGWVVLSGDAAHFRSNWEARRVPSINFDAVQTRASMERLAGIVAERDAQLWINHDKAQSDAQQHAPAWYR
jgi:glyoxylase-like metal-dependent hydrolase (beta-lactamase superfamily II)